MFSQFAGHSESQISKEKQEQWASGLIKKFINRSPDDASVKNKMIFASSKEAIRRRLDGALLKTTVYMTALMTFQPFIILSCFSNTNIAPNICRPHTTQVSIPRSRLLTSPKSPRMSVSARPIFILLFIAI